METVTKSETLMWETLMRDESVPLEDSQVGLLVDLVEASRREASDSRAEFMALAATQSYPRLYVRHPGLAKQYVAHLSDLEELESVGLLRLRVNAKRDVWHFSVRPEGFRFYAEHMRQLGTPIERVEKVTRRLLDQLGFQQRYPEAYQSLALAEGLLWVDGSQDQLTAIGHHCREAMQEFISVLVAQARPPEVSANPANTVARLQAVVRSRLLGDSVSAFLEALIAYWGTLSDLVQRQEHGGKREGRPLALEDARRVVFQTLNVMYEVDRALA